MTQNQSLQGQGGKLETLDLLTWRWRRVQAEKRESDVNRDILRRMH